MWPLSLWRQAQLPAAIYPHSVPGMKNDTFLLSFWRELFGVVWREVSEALRWLEYSAQSRYLTALSITWVSAPHPQITFVLRGCWHLSLCLPVPGLVPRHPIFRSSQRWRILKQIWSYHYLNSMLRPFCAFSHNSRQIAHNSAGCSMSFRLNFVVPASTPGMLWGSFSPRWLPFIKFLLSFCM